MSTDKPGHTGDSISVKISMVFSIGLKTKLIVINTNSL